jgi:hypothetical protein
LPRGGARISPAALPVARCRPRAGRTSESTSPEGGEPPRQDNITKADGRQKEGRVSVAPSVASHV